MRTVFVAVGCLLASTLGAMAQSPKPAIIYESLLDMYFDDSSGLIGFREYDIAFAPQGQLNAEVAVVNSEGTVIARFPFFEDVRYREGVFARAMVRGPADVTLTEPGVYNIVFLIDGEMATRLPVVLEQTSAGEDPFNPEKTYQFYGLWQVFAYLTGEEFKERPHYRVHLWVGGRDLAEGDDKDMFFVTLRRNGEVIGHSKRTLGHINEGHYERRRVDIFKPHEYKDTANAQFVPKADWVADGDYEIVVQRKSDDTVIRVYRYRASEGEIEHLDSTKLGAEPRVDYMVPRVTDKSTQNYDFEEAVWIRGGVPNASGEAQSGEPAGAAGEP